MPETEHLSLEHLQDQYLIDLKQLICHNEKVMSSTFKGRVFTEDEFVHFKQKFTAAPYHQTGFWCVIEKHSKQCIGFCGLIPCNYLDRQDFEFGFVLDDQFWGKGYGTEIGKASIEYAKNQLLLPRVLAVTAPGNIASNTVLLNLGMKPQKKIMSDSRGERMIYLIEF